MLEPDKFEPITVPVEETELGVMLPNTKVIAGVVDPLATVPDTPFAAIIEVEVTVPVPGVKPRAVITSPEANVMTPVRELNDATPAGADEVEL